MARKKAAAKKKPAAKKRTKTGPGAGAKLLAWAKSDAGRLTLRGLAVLVIAAGIVVGAAYGLRRVEVVAERSLASSGPIGVEVSWPAEADATESWLPVSEQRRLRALALEAIARSGGVLDGAAVHDASVALLGTGWFVEAPRVRWTRSTLAHIEGEWRSPAAVVRRDGRDQLISWTGVPLPLEYPAGRSGVRFLDEPFRGPPRASEGPHAVWPGEDVAGGLALLEMLQAHPEVYRQVAGIDLNGGQTLEIITDQGSRVVWGSAPGVFAPGEQPDTVKLERLRALREAQGRIDGGRAWMNIRGGEVLVGDAAP